MHTFLQSYYILFPFDILQLCLEDFSPAFIIYLILKLLPFLVQRGGTSTIGQIWMCCSFFSYLCFLAQTLSFIHISLDFVFLVSALDKNIKFMGLLKNSHNSNKLYPPLFSPSQLISPRRCSSIRQTLRVIMDSILILPNFPQCVILSVFPWIHDAISF